MGKVAKIRRPKRHNTQQNEIDLNSELKRSYTLAENGIEAVFKGSEFLFYQINPVCDPSKK